jgi:hypothetical protein
MLVSILSGFRAPFHTLRLLVGGREDGRGYGAFGGPGKRGGNKKETVGSCAVDCQGMRENGRAPPSRRPLVWPWVDARMAEDMDMVPWWPRKEGRQQLGTVGCGAVWIDCHG